MTKLRSTRDGTSVAPRPEATFDKAARKLLELLRANEWFHRTFWPENEARVRRMIDDVARRFPPGSGACVLDVGQWLRELPLRTDGRMGFRVTGAISPRIQGCTIDEGGAGPAVRRRTRGTPSTARRGAPGPPGTAGPAKPEPQAIANADHGGSRRRWRPIMGTWCKGPRPPPPARRRG